MKVIRHTGSTKKDWISGTVINTISYGVEITEPFLLSNLERHPDFEIDEVLIHIADIDHEPNHIRTWVRGRQVKGGFDLSQPKKLGVRVDLDRVTLKASPPLYGLRDGITDKHAHVLSAFIEEVVAFALKSK